jgi:2'-phosphotransferase
MASSSHDPDTLIDKAQELDLNHNERGSRSNRGGGKGKGGRGGKGGTGGMDRDVAISKALSKLLRHAAADAGLVLDGEGYGRVDQVVCSFSSLI